MDMRGYQKYQQESVNTMTQGELLLMLYDGLVKKLTIAELELKKENYLACEENVERSIDIIHYLSDTLDKKYPISKELEKLYEYFCYELNRVKIGRNQTELARVKTMVIDLRDTFRQADKSAVSGM